MHLTADSYCRILLPMDDVNTSKRSPVFINIRLVLGDVR